MKNYFAFIMSALLFCGCTAKEGDQFYALQKQDNQLYVTVSNLQQEVNVLAAQNSSLKSQIDTNAYIMALLLNSESNLQSDLMGVTNQLSFYNGDFYDLSNKIHGYQIEEADQIQKLQSTVSKAQKLNTP